MLGLAEKEAMCRQDIRKAASMNRVWTGEACDSAVWPRTGVSQGGTAVNRERRVSRQVCRAGACGDFLRVDSGTCGAWKHSHFKGKSVVFQRKDALEEREHKQEKSS